MITNIMKSLSGPKRRKEMSEEKDGLKKFGFIQKSWKIRPLLDPPPITTGPYPPTTIDQHDDR
jgi:hypothetical protein